MPISRLVPICTLAAIGLAAPTLAQTVETDREVRIGASVIQWQPVQRELTNSSRRSLSRIQEIEGARRSGEPLAPAASVERSTMANGLISAAAPIDRTHVMSIRPLETAPREREGLLEPRALDPLWMQMSAWGTTCHRAARPASASVPSVEPARTTAPQRVADR